MLTEKPESVEAGVKLWTKTTGEERINQSRRHTFVFIVDNVVAKATKIGNRRVPGEIVRIQYNKRSPNGNAVKCSTSICEMSAIECARDAASRQHCISKRDT